MVRFVHWGISEERTVPAAIAELGGQRLTPARLSFDELPAGVTYGGSLSPGHGVEDVLVFDPPPATGPLRLDLPAEAWGGRGVFRFLVPASMITSPSPPKSGNR